MINKSIFKFKNLIFLVFILLFSTILFSQTNNLEKNVNFNRTESKPKSFLAEALFNHKKNNLPYFSENLVLTDNLIPSFKLKNSVIRNLTSSELALIESYKKYITSDFQITYNSGISRQEKLLYANIVPIRLNSSNIYEYLVSYETFWDYSNAKDISTYANLNRSNNRVAKVSTSVLASGKWYKVGVTKDGVYKIDKTFLTNLGIDVSAVNPRNIKVYGNGGKLMPERNSDFKYDDLQENAIKVVGEGDGVFDNADYVLFYGQSTDSWVRSSSNRIPYHRKLHSFSDTSFYFINVDINTLGKRINDQSSLAVVATKTTTTQDYYDIHEVNAFNAVKSGREFYGEKFDLNTSYVFNFLIPDAVIGDSVYVKSRVMSRCATISNYAVTFGPYLFNVSCPLTNVDYYIADYGYPNDSELGGILNSSFLSVTVSKQTPSAVGYLDYVEINARKSLNFTSSQFNFRDRRVIGGAGTFAKYNLLNPTGAAISIWDVTSPLNVSNQLFSTIGSALDFTATSDSLREYVAFSPATAFIPTPYGTVPNQNLHAITQADFVIVTHPAYLNEANRIAKVHADYDTLSYAIATTTQVYNEFSSGTPDIGAIKEFVRMLYFRPTDPTKATKYLLLLGDGSYKNRDITLSGNTAMIPTYETPNSTSYTESFVSDDYFAMMDHDEGALVGTSNDSLSSGRGDLPDIGVGRFPVHTKAEAEEVTSKIEQYYKRNFGFNPNTEESSCSAATCYPQGDWRNSIVFLADDEDSNEHLRGAENVANIVYNTYKDYNVNKIYSDAYQQYSTPGGDRYPDVVNAINRSFEKGCLIFNYTGHGGELGLGAERFVEVPQILGWKNNCNLPLMVTATCEFSRFDDPDRTSAGEYCFLNPQGGAVGLMTTVRLAFSGLNDALNIRFFNHALKPMINGKIPHIGDLYRLTKRDLGFNPQYLNFVILGDPALKLAYPEQKVYTSTINSQTISLTSSDTLKALTKMVITGFVGDKLGNKLTNFNGVVYPTVYDKELKLVTLANDPSRPGFSGSLVDTFKIQRNIIYRGKSLVTNGDFSFTFLVPKDISYNFGKGKISYYAHNGVHDANGYYDHIVIGGSNPLAVADAIGPEIKLFMNDEKFVTGGTTNENPKIYALVSDSSGINTVGNGIGHDLIAVLDAKSGNPIVLNDYYVANLNTYQSGKIRYSLSDLPEGKHDLTLKVWDVQNNSSTAYTDFIVSKEADLALSHILNYPNPFTSKTKFFIEHNQCCVSLKVQIQIYTITGKIVKSINQTINNQGFRFDGIEWDGRDEFGDKLARGVYIYRVSVTDGANKKADKIEKLVILN